MPKEVERKYLVNQAKLTLPDNGIAIKQGYLPIDATSKTVVRVRLKGERAYLTIKGENTGAVRAEYEYAIPVSEAEEMLNNLCQTPFIDKTRYEVPVGAHTWEVDIFAGDNAGLVVAEIELTDEQEPYQLPGWAGDEVTHDPKYYNSSLLHHPYKDWA